MWLSSDSPLLTIARNGRSCSCKAVSSSIVGRYDSVLVTCFSRDGAVKRINLRIRRTKTSTRKPIYTVCKLGTQFNPYQSLETLNLFFSILKGRSSTFYPKEKDSLCIISWFGLASVSDFFQSLISTFALSFCFCRVQTSFEWYKPSCQGLSGDLNSATWDLMGRPARLSTFMDPNLSWLRGPVVQSLILRSILLQNSVGHIKVWEKLFEHNA